jgi:hypothetical protein
MKLIILRDTFIRGKPAAKDSVVEVPDKEDIGALLFYGAADPFDATKHKMRPPQTSAKQPA